MTDAEIKTQREHDEKMAQLHSEFLSAWRGIRTKLPPATPVLEQAAWLGFLAGAGRKQDALRKALNDVIAAALKRGDAPASSATHENSAIVALLQLVPYWQPFSSAARELVADAKQHMEHYPK
jgi:hypothetical protein